MAKFKDLTGQRFGKLTVVSYAGNQRWNCVCDCGNTKNVHLKNLGRNVNSCGCLKTKTDLIGHRFGKLVVTERVGRNKHNNVLWKCKCDCGGETITTSHCLLCGDTKSCGCIRNKYFTEKKYDLLDIQEKFENTIPSDTPIYRSWSAMRSRCRTENNPAYKNYGGRGITVCDEWLGENGFINFYNWSIQNGYADGLTIDRIDNNGDYTPNNCRWITREEQQKNKRNNTIITCDGKSMIISDWARELGVNRSMISWRKRNGWTDEECIKGKKK